MYMPHFRAKKSGLPVLNKAQIDDIAERLIKDFFPRATEVPTAIDVDGLAQNYLGLYQDFQYLSHNGVYLGMTIFRDTNEVPVYDPETRRAEFISARARTIIIDNGLLDNRQEQRYRFTVGHEAAHAILHSGYFSCTAERKGGEPIIQCRKDKSVFSSGRKTVWTDSDWMEWQANNLSSALLMPRCMVHKLTDGMNAKSSAFQSAACMRAVSNTFNVSLQAAEIRLKDLGIMGDFKKSDIDYELDFLPRIV